MSRRDIAVEWHVTAGYCCGVVCHDGILLWSVVCHDWILLWSGMSRRDIAVEWHVMKGYCCSGCAITGYCYGRTWLQNPGVRR